jgi:predicted phage terminase large subunit-like protein
MAGDVELKPETDKRARLISQVDLFEGGSVRLPRRASWLEEFIAELLAFPGRHDDQVDALTQETAKPRIRLPIIGSAGSVSF